MYMCICMCMYNFIYSLLTIHSLLTTSLTTHTSNPHHTRLQTPIMYQSHDLHTIQN